MQSEFVPVPKEFKGHVIGKDGYIIEDIRQKSGAQVRSPTGSEEAGFTVSGNAEQIACAKRLILEIVDEKKRGIWEPVEIPDGYKGLIIGKGGANLREISKQTGAEVTRKRGEVHIISGTTEQRDHVKVIIGMKVAYARLSRVENEFNKVKFQCFVDGCNLPENCRLKLEKVQEGDRVVFPGTQTQYRLKPTEEFEVQDSFFSGSDPSYLEQLSRAVLESLDMFKRERDAKNDLQPDMWCHFGRAIIRGPNEDAAAEGEWSIDEATGKFQSSAEGNYWRIAFNEGLDLSENIFKRNYREIIPEEYTDYATRYDLTFLSPDCYQIRCKVWVTKEGTMKKLEDIPIPPSDVKNILEEIHFEDESTRSRCRGWLILASRRYLQADILFPGCEFDCRFSVRGQTESAEVFDYVPKEEVRRILSEYLSGLTLTKDDAFGLRLPEKEIPKGFRFIHKRSSKRTAYAVKPGFSIILSKECSWRSVVAEERSRNSIDLHLHCDEWNQSFSSGQWEPEVIVRKLPEFLLFIKEVQGFVVRELQGDGQLKAPPEILARGQLALEVYNNALAEGSACVKRVPLMLIGQDRSGKTSLKKSLKGIIFDPDEDSTVGIDVDRYHFEVTTETWMTGKKDEESTTDGEAISFEHNAARLVAERLMEVGNVLWSERATDVGSENYGLEVTEIPIETQLRESSIGPEPISSQKRDPPAGEVPNSTEQSPEGDAPFTTQVQMPRFEEISVITETLLQDGMAENSGDIYSIMWDFAGQSVYYATHPLFLTARAIYLLTYDLSLNPDDIAKPVVKQGVYKKFQDNFNQKTNLDYLDFWLASVASLASQDKHNNKDHESEVLPEQLPAVFLVCTHADQPHNGCDPFELAKEIFGTLKVKPYGGQLCGVFAVDNTKSGSQSECSEVMRLREEVLAAAKALPHVNDVIPIKWLKYEKALKMLRNNGRKWISLELAKHIMSKRCSINSDDEMLTLLNFLHDLRLLIHFDDTPELNDVVVLDLQWLIDVFKEVITVRPYLLKDKKFADLWYQLERDGILEEKLLKHVWSSLITRRERFECLIAIMEKFSLLYPLPLHVDGSSSKQYLVPSMLKSHPPEDISDLVASAQVPSLFLKFETGQVPAGFFPRLVIEFIQWCTDKLPRQERPLVKLFNGFARFYNLPAEGRSVVLLCHSLSIELILPTSKKTFDTSDANLACAVRNKLASMIECMQNKFFWVKNVVCALNFLCPVCCRRGEVISYCPTHNAKGCKQEECLHFFPDSKLAADDKWVFCDRSATAQDNRVSVAHFAPWFPSEHSKDLSPTRVPITPDAPAKENEGKFYTALSVTLVASEWDSSKGGLSTVNRELAIELAQHEQVKVTLLVPKDSCSEEGKRNAASYKVSIIEADRRPGYDDPLDWLSFPPRGLAMDIIVGHGGKLGKQGQVIRESHKCKWVQVVHTAPEELGIHKDYPKAISKGEQKNRTEVDLCKLADVVVTVGPKLKEAYSSYLRSCEKHQDIIQLTPGLFHEFADIRQATDEGANFKVLTFGRGDPEDFSLKGYDISAEAIVELKDSSYFLVFVGAPEEKQEEVAENLLQSGISKNQLIVRTFIQSKERLKELFCEVDLVIMPSRTEGFGLTALEALSAGLPILVSGNSGFGDTLRTLPLGKQFVVDSVHPKDWAKAIEAVRLKDRAKRLQEIQRLRTSYEEKFSWKKQCGVLVQKMWTLVHDLPGQMFVNLQQMQRDVSKVSSCTDLLAELEKIASEKGFVISDNEGSGNCMFLALSEQLNLVKGIKIPHGELRRSIVQYLRKNPKLPDGTHLFNFTDGYQSWADYLSNMEQDGTWGDHVILYGTANCFKTHIDVISSHSNHRDLTIRPDGHVISTNPLVLGHVQEVHYVSLQPKQGLQSKSH